ncbi:2,5-diketo-D-gluconic acid reductase [Paenibacillus sp. FSL R7-0273]|uniref:aldo/keto reductase n=1 Tax=Paenibacillus sp. FSL R7-0273 TaxID=1536772 RepID=UPI0004F7004A|nr:aldo/keto reductase [Paenibacillus sp. FSL R7-0273]AIQ44649.1 2,5-diketo-D-gluconic acid reductase [Paenibacillus sp. FSL R7-0273]OMF88213.1 2,5-diketo-D-gluconic acid reductase [Paenibacillus sp. FSL R7-0273]
MNQHISEKVLNDGLKIPAIGFGTAFLKGTDGVKAITGAIETGYRLIDSAFNYENEGAVGQAVRKSGLPREELRITSKLPGRHHAYKEALETIEESLYRAGLDYYDLYLIHWPNPKTDKYVEAWQAMIEAKKRGYVRSIGVCNFLPEHNERIIKETGVAPSINQVELHPLFNQELQRAKDAGHGIVTESWSPLGRGHSMLKNEEIAAIAAAHGKTPTQAILRWHIQLGAVPIPRTSSVEHQKENLEIFDFELSEAEMKVISAMSKPDGRLWEQNPAEYEEM